MSVRTNQEKNYLMPMNALPMPVKRPEWLRVGGELIFMSILLRAYDQIKIPKLFCNTLGQF